MPRRRDRLRPGACLYPGGHHGAAWRHPSVKAEAGIDAAHARQIARTAEAARFDLIVLADGVSLRGDDRDATTSRDGAGMATLRATAAPAVIV